MQPLDDYPLGSGPGGDGAPPPAQRGPGSQKWALIVIGALAAVLVAAFIFLRKPVEVGSPAGEAAAPAAADVGSAPPRALGPEVPARELPPLDEMDPVVREMLRGLSARPELAAWLATDDLVRGLAVSIDTVANGGTPSGQLRRLAPERPFAVRPRGEGLVIDPAAYARFDGLADTVASMDAEAVARAYATLRPRLQEAYQELGYPDGDIDRAVERAIGRLLSTPVVEREVAVQQAPVLYQFSDPALERLSPAQKQLLRMGPRNVRLIQTKLRELSRALGAPS
jgi:hypothetical protein